MKLKHLSLITAIGFLFIPSLVLSQTDSMDKPAASPPKELEAFRQYIDVTLPDIAAPAVIEAPLPAERLERLDIAVYDTTTRSFEPYFFKQTIDGQEVSVTARTDQNGTATNMLDDDIDTYTEFPVPDTGQGSVTINLSADEPVTSSALTLLLDNHVALPNTIEIRAGSRESKKIVVAQKEMKRRTVTFPQTTAAEWTIALTYGQPLRISELKLHQKDTEKDTRRIVRWLAQPDRDYQIYFDADRFVDLETGEAGNLRSDEDVLSAVVSDPRSNPLYQQADVDGDGVPDALDNCVYLANPKQTDVNNNGRGDACDDFDRDGIINSRDNCPNHPNRNQKDTDGDGIGDACDEEESRLTEKYPWLPWLGIGSAAAVIVTLFAVTAMTGQQQTPPENKPQNPDNTSPDEQDEQIEQDDRTSKPDDNNDQQRRIDQDGR